MSIMLFSMLWACSGDCDGFRSRRTRNHNSSSMEGHDPEDTAMEPEDTGPEPEDTADDSGGE